MKEKFIHILSASILCIIFSLAAFAQTSEFTFQGKLTDQNSAANGPYDLSFKLFDGANVQIGTTLLREDVQVTSGVFTVLLDFGSTAFDGGARSIEISVRPGASSGSFTALSPRQAVTSTPYAVVSQKATTADTATNATQLGGTAASQYVKTNDARLTDARNPLPGSSSYIQNSPTATQNANFYISGVGSIGTRLGIGSVSGFYKMEVRDGSNSGLRVQNDTAGGTIASFGGYGEFQIDAPGVPGGRFMVKENGRVGIGTDQPQTNFDVLNHVRVFSVNQSGVLPGYSWYYPSFGNADMHKWHVYTNGSALNFASLNDAETDERVWLQVTRSTGVNLGRVVFPNSVVALDVLGTSGGNALCLNSSNQIARCSSSIRYKQNVTDYTPGLSLIKNLRPVSFNWKVDNKPDFGLIAEEVAAIEPLLASYNEKGEIEGVKYDRVGVVLVNALKEQQAQIERQQQQIEALTKLVCATSASAPVCGEKE